MFVFLFQCYSTILYVNYLFHSCNYGLSILSVVHSLHQAAEQGKYQLCCELRSKREAVQSVTSRVPGSKLILLRVSQECRADVPI